MSGDTIPPDILDRVRRWQREEAPGTISSEEEAVSIARLLLEERNACAKTSALLVYRAQRGKCANCDRPMDECEKDPCEVYR